METTVHAAADTSTEAATVPTAPGRSSGAWLARNRAVAVAIFLVVSAAGVLLFGFPERPYVVIWLVVAVVATCWHSPRPAARFAIDWLPVLVIAAGYDLVRSFGPDLVPRAVVKPQLRFDEALFGGTAPTVRLQRWLSPGDPPHWWEYIVFTFYLSHFVVTPAIAAYLYVRDRARFERFAWMILGMTLAGFVTYLIVPAVPPWMASRQGALEPTVRVVHDIWLHLGLADVAEVFDGGNGLANPVGALPSEHAAWPFMILLFVWRSAPRGRWVALAFNAVMVLVLVYGSEHYLADILLGWVYAIVAFVIVNRVFDRRAATSSPAPGAARTR